MERYKTLFLKEKYFKYGVYDNLLYNIKVHSPPKVFH